MGYALKVACDRLQKIADGFVAALPSLGLALVTFTLFWAIWKFVRTTVRRATERRGNVSGAGMAMGRIAQGVVLLVGTLVSHLVDCARQREGWPAGRGEVPGSAGVARALGAITAAGTNKTAAAQRSEDKP